MLGRRLSTSRVRYNFEQAITGYTAGLELKTQLLPLSSRQLAEAQYKLSIALDLTADGLTLTTIHHAQRALESFERA